MHNAVGSDYASAIGLADRLMTETDPEDGNAAAPSANGSDADTCLRGSARSRRQYDGRRRENANVIDGDRVIAAHFDLRAQLTEVLDEVIREGIVIVDDEQHRRLFRVTLWGETAYG